MKFFHLLLFVFILLLTACQQGAQDKKAIVFEPKNDNEQLEHPAVIQLWNEANQAKTNLHYALAANKIQQALKILPNKAILWSRLAELAMLQKNTQVAEDFATRSNAYSGNNKRLLKRNWLIIKHARLQRNDQVGASQAALKIQKLSF